MILSFHFTDLLFICLMFLTVMGSKASRDGDVTNRCNKEVKHMEVKIGKLVDGEALKTPELSHQDKHHSRVMEKAFIHN